MDETKALHGLVIRQSEYKESSYIVEILTLERGRMSFIAQGAKRSKSKSQNLTELFVSATYNLTGSKSLLYLKDGQIDDAHLGLRKSIYKMTGASYMTELILQTAMEDETVPELYHLLASGWKALEQSQNATAVARVLAAFTLKLSCFLGFRPQLGSCMSCGSEDLDGAGFDTEEGGVICRSCGASHSGWKPMSKGAYLELTNYIRYGLQQLPLTDESAEKASADHAFTVDMHRLMRRYYVEQTGMVRAKTAKALEDLGLL